METNLHISKLMMRFEMIFYLTISYLTLKSLIVISQTTTLMMRNLAVKSNHSYTKCLSNEIVFFCNLLFHNILS